MARQTGIVVTNDFSRGLFTEGTPLNTPENSSTEIWDVVINPDKTITRRPGWDNERLSSEHTIDRVDGVVNGWQWNNAAGDGSIDVYILQVGGTLHFFKATDPYSNVKSAATITLSTYSPAGAMTPNTVECQFTQGNGLVFITHPFLESFYLTFTDIDNITATQINPQIRDFAGIVSLGQDDATVLGVDTRETAGIGDLNVQHKYNLFNQGWHYNTNAALTAWDTARTDMPSNADIWWAFADSSGDWANAQVARIDLGNSPAPKGHYILNVYNEDRDAASGLSGIADVTTGTQRASTSAFFAGRWWMGGINSTGRNTYVYFTQVIQAVAQYDYMYQQNDPTVETTPDLLANDGGFITIPDSGTIFKLQAQRQAILVFAQNGIWAITGSTGIGFAANDFTVVQVSDTPSTTAKTFVTAEGFPFWWNDDGIHSLTESEGGVGFKVVDIVDDSIKTFFEAIPLVSRRHAKGGYNPILKTLQWIYQSTEQSTVDDLQVFDKVLNFNLREGAWVPWTIGAGDYKLHDVIVTTALNQTVTNETVVSDFGYSATVGSTFGTDKIDWVAHGLVNGDYVRFTTSAADLPDPLVIDLDYYVVNKTADDFEVSLTSGGAAVTLTDDGTGTHTAWQQDSPVVWKEGVFTSNFAVDDKLDTTAHGLIDTEQVRLHTTAGDLPSGFAIDTTYYVINKTADDFELSATSGGAAISPADDGTGTHTWYGYRTGDTVLAAVISGSEASPGFKYVVSEDDGASSDSFTFAETNDTTTWLDWTSNETTGVGYESYLITNYSIRGDAMRKQQTPYVSTFMAQETGAGLLMQGLWDYSANTTSGKFTTTQQCYSTKRTNFDVNVKRLKLRGTGRSLQLKYSSQAGKPFTIIGWAKAESVSGDV